jgi:hypothetical protein
VFRHQWLTDEIGHPKLQQHVASVTTLMRISDNWTQFKELLERGHKKYLKLPLYDDLDENETVE